MISMFKLYFTAIVDIIEWKYDGQCGYRNCCGHWTKRWLWRQFKSTRDPIGKGDHG